MFFAHLFFFLCNSDFFSESGRKCKTISFLPLISLTLQMSCEREKEEIVLGISSKRARTEKKSATEEEHTLSPATSKDVLPKATSHKQKSLIEFATAILEISRSGEQFNCDCSSESEASKCLGWSCFCDLPACECAPLRCLAYHLMGVENANLAVMMVDGKEQGYTCLVAEGKK